MDHAPAHKARVQDSGLPSGDSQPPATRSRQRPPVASESASAALAAVAKELVALRTAIDGASATLERFMPLLREIATSTDDWVSQRTTKIGRRIHCRICKDLVGKLDPRASRRGRLYLLRQSVIDEYLRGSPEQRDLSPGEALLVELDEQEARRNEEAWRAIDQLEPSARPTALSRRGRPRLALPTRSVRGAAAPALTPVERCEQKLRAKGFIA